MDTLSDKEFLRAASDVLPDAETSLLRTLHGFTSRRRIAAEASRKRLLDALARGDDEGAETELHSFLRECWEILDGLAREVNLCMQHLLPDAGLYPPFQMTRQCTFYVIRKKLHEHPDAADHPVSRLLWECTRGSPDEAYERLSFLHNLSLFSPIPLLPNATLPGSDDVSDTLRPLLKPAAVPAAEAGQATEETLQWLADMVSRCHSALARALS